MRRGRGAAADPSTRSTRSYAYRDNIVPLLWCVVGYVLCSIICCWQLAFALPPHAGACRDAARIFLASIDYCDVPNRSCCGSAATTCVAASPLLSFRRGGHHRGAATACLHSVDHCDVPVEADAEMSHQPFLVASRVHGAPRGILFGGVALCGGQSGMVAVQ